MIARLLDHFLIRFVASYQHDGRHPSDDGCADHLEVIHSREQDNTMGRPPEQIAHQIASRAGCDVHIEAVFPHDNCCLQRISDF